MQRLSFGCPFTPEVGPARYRDLRGDLRGPTNRDLFTFTAKVSSGPKNRLGAQRAPQITVNATSKDIARLPDSVYCEDMLSISSDEHEILMALKRYGPLSVAVYAGNGQKRYGDWQLYTPDINRDGIDSLVFDKCVDLSVNHAVLLVGWGKISGKDVWMIKNQWKAAWGWQGFMLFPRGVNCFSINTLPLTGFLFPLN